MSRKFTNIKVSEKFFKELSGEFRFQNQWQAIAGVWDLLQWLLILDKKSTSICSSTINKKLNPYLDRENRGYYRQYLNVLVRLGLLKINEFHRISKNKTGQCKSYGLTDKSLDYLINDNKQNLRKLCGLPAAKHKSKPQTKQNKIKNDYVLNYYSNVLSGLSCDRAKAASEIKNKSQKSRAITETLLDRFKDNNLNTLKRNKKDGRIWNEFVALDSSVRKHFKFRNLKRIANADIVGCHCRYFGDFIKFNYTNNNQIPLLSLSLNTIQDTTLCVSTDFKQNLSGDILDKEVADWNNLFHNPDFDGRDIIAKELNRTKKQIKNDLNKIINGSNRQKITLNYLKKRFPVLMSLRNKATGPGISKHFESKITQSKKLIKLARKYGFILMYEYDGFSIFGPENIRKFRCFIRELRKMFGEVKFKVDRFFEPSKHSENTVINEPKQVCCGLKSNLEFCLGP